MKRRRPEILGTCESDGVTHVCFKWRVQSEGRDLWSTVCMLNDSVFTFNVDDWGYAVPTCVYCVAGIIAKDE